MPWGRTAAPTRTPRWAGGGRLPERPASQLGHRGSPPALGGAPPRPSPGRPVLTRCAWPPRDQLRRHQSCLLAAGGMTRPIEPRLRDAELEAKLQPEDRTEAPGRPRQTQEPQPRAAPWAPRAFGGGCGASGPSGRFSVCPTVPWGPWSSGAGYPPPGRARHQQQKRLSQPSNALAHRS